MADVARVRLYVSVYVYFSRFKVAVRTVFL